MCICGGVVEGVAIVAAVPFVVKLWRRTKKALFNWAPPPLLKTSEGGPLTFISWWFYGKVSGCNHTYKRNWAGKTWDKIFS